MGARYSLEAIRLACSQVGLEVNLLCLLAIVRSDSPSMGDLSVSQGVSSSAATGTVGRAEKLGLVERVPNPEDGRSTLVRITGRGVQVLANFDAKARLAESGMGVSA